jgi:hypothetical protein
VEKTEQEKLEAYRVECMKNIREWEAKIRRLTMDLNDAKQNREVWAYRFDYTFRPSRGQ